MSDYVLPNKPWWKPGFLSLSNFRDIVLLLFLGVLVWKLIETNITVQDLRFSDVLSLTMALFAVGLSVAFYFKATDTSNRFYDNVYKFTKEVSELLGRIEAGFGERLRHLDEGQAKLGDTVARLPLDLPRAKEKEAAEKREVQDREQKIKGIINELMDRAKLDSAEKTSLTSRLAKTQAELEASRTELRRLQDAINQAEAFSSMDDVLSHFLPLMDRAGISPAMSSSQIKIALTRAARNLPHNSLRCLTIARLIDEDNQPTPQAFALIDQLFGRVQQHHPASLTQTPSPCTK